MKVTFIKSDGQRGEAEAHARALRAAAPQSRSISVIGPAEAALALIRGRYRFRLLVHGARGDDMQSFLAAMLENGPRARGSVKVQVDIDPQSFL